MEKLRRKIHAYFSESLLPQWTVLFIDLSICVVSMLVAYFVVSDFSFSFIKPGFLINIFITLAVCIFYFRLFHTYLGILRYSSIVDIMKIFLSLGLSVITMFAINLIGNVLFDYTMFLSPAVLIFFFVAVLIMVVLRLIVKFVFEKYFVRGKRKQRVLIFGAGIDGVSIASALPAILRVPHEFRGFITNDFNLAGNTILGERVYANDDNIASILAMRKITTVIVSPHNLENITKSKLFDIFMDLGIDIKTISISSQDKEDFKIEKVREIQIEDLLGRSEIKVDEAAIESNNRDKRVLVTGAAGSIGSELVYQIAKYSPALLVIIDQAETPLHHLKLNLQERFPNVVVATYLGSVQNLGRMESIFAEHKPEYIYHAAAYKHVPMVEDNPIEAVETNITGTKNIADLAVKYKAKKFVQISTDKAVNPTNVMGATKRAAEIYVQSLNKKLSENENSHTQFVTTRFGNVLGSNGSVIPLFRSQIEKGGPITITHPDIMRFFMTISEACSLVLEACQIGKGGEIFVFDMGKQVKIVDLATRMIRLAGLEPNVDIKIKYVGLRQGEKLYEELLSKAENLIPTTNKKIFVARVREYDFVDIEHKIKDIIDTAKNEGNTLSVRKLKELIPEYISNNSVYERMDKEIQREN